ncbi:hypothetical protein [Mycobacterium sp. 1465703.0]|uniref:hypothetical protein n=1 Tax=Mycobacterium sp. 1465703.0 TaxID=1834078 RepID=UPI0007FE0620|nr:hypothetical protein [Mycobacterium sp. 1465703.0]OBJ01004.1 hypothetical protein A5625_25910 [Mycobacterium sp. 1465703.0]
MTAARKLCTPLTVITDTAEDTTDLDVEWRSQTVIDEYSPEHQFVGSLMWLTAEQARPLLELVPDNAIWRPQTRWVYELIRALVDAGTDPTPVTVLAAGRCQSARHALEPSESPSAHQHKQLALYLFDAYSQAIAPTASIRSYAREVLEEAYRRAFDTFGIKMQQLAACGADRDDLTEQFGMIRDELAELWRRAEAAKP